MKALKSLFLALTITAAGAGLTAAQVTIDRSGVSRQTANVGAEEGNVLIDEIFSPITARLNLSASQKFRIANIATATMIQAEPLFQQLDDLEDQLSEAAFTGRLEESTIKQVSEKQAEVLSQIVAMKARAKLSFYRLLTAEQRAVVADQFRSRAGEGRLGSISN
jgi:Spy/CpxP family protein refolding chaperone